MDVHGCVVGLGKLVTVCGGVDGDGSGKERDVPS